MLFALNALVSLTFLIEFCCLTLLVYGYFLKIYQKQTERVKEILVCKVRTKERWLTLGFAKTRLIKTKQRRQNRNQENFNP